VTGNWRRTRKQRQRAARALRRYGAALRRRRGVVGVGIGPRCRAGKWHQGEVCLQVFVLRKAPLEAIPPRSRLPTRLGGCPVDVLEGDFVGLQACPVVTRPRRLRFDPLVGGIAVSNPTQPDFGTLGAVLRDDTRAYVLTAAHVAGGPGSSVAQPFLPPDTFGPVLVSRWSSQSNLDAALIGVHPGAGRSVAPGMFQGPTGTLGTGDIRNAPGSVVVHGACSGQVRAEIVSLPSEITVRYLGGPSVTFRGHAVIRVVAGTIAPGDSGAVVLAAGTRTMLGLLIAGRADGLLGVVTPLPYILDAVAFQPNGQRLRGV
jgi:hypothetical protein